MVPFGRYAKQCFRESLTFLDVFDTNVHRTARSVQKARSIQASGNSTHASLGEMMSQTPAIECAQASASVEDSPTSDDVAGTLADFPPPVNASERVEHVPEHVPEHIFEPIPVAATGAAEQDEVARLSQAVANMADARVDELVATFDATMVAAFAAADVIQHPLPEVYDVPVVFPAGPYDVTFPEATAAPALDLTRSPSPEAASESGDGVATRRGTRAPRKPDADYVGPSRSRARPKKTKKPTTASKKTAARR